MREEKNNLYYNDMYIKYEHYSLNIDGYTSGYKDLYNLVKNLLNKNEKLLEIGCGSGQFAEILIKEKFNYVLGFDFSEVGISMSIERCKINLFKCLNVYTFDFLSLDYDTIISLEVFEHIENDIEILNKIPINKRIIFSVPSFDDIAHVRFFNNKNDIMTRFSHFFTKFKIYQLRNIFIIDAIK